MAGETYTVSAGLDGWQVMQRKPGGKTQVCTAKNRAEAERIALALNVMPTVEQAARELVEGKMGGPGSVSLARWYRQLDSRRKQQLVVGESLSCLTGMGRLLITIIVGAAFVMGVIALLMRLLG